MQFDTVRRKIVKAFENAGIMFSTEDDDPVLEDYFEDSVQYITAIVEIENALEIEVPDEFLLPENMQTLDTFSRSMMEIIRNDEEISRREVTR